jgi:hypothetical protein
MSCIDVKFQRHEFPFEALALSERIKILLAQNTVNLVLHCDPACLLDMAYQFSAYLPSHMIASCPKSFF